MDFCQKSSKLFCSFATMTTYYFKDPEEALKRAKAAGKRPGCWYGGISLRSGKKGWAIYHGGKVVEQYAVITPTRCDVGNHREYTGVRVFFQCLH